MSAFITGTEEVQLSCLDTGWRSLLSCFSPLLKMLDGNFPCNMGALHAIIFMVWNFSPCPGHWVFILCVREREFSVYLCVVSVWVYMPLEISSSEHERAEFRSFCGSGHGAGIVRFQTRPKSKGSKPQGSTPGLTSIKTQTEYQGHLRLLRSSWITSLIKCSSV